MYNLIFKAILLILLLPLTCYSETIIDADSKLTIDKTCLTGGMDNLKIKYSYITENDAKSISLYACSCAYKASQKSLILIEAADFRNDKNCIYYGVLRNALGYKMNSASETAPAKDTTSVSINKLCVATFPRDLNDDSVNIDITNFCNCASPLTEKIAKDIKPSTLDENQIYEKLITVINGCRYSI